MLSTHHTNMTHCAFKVLLLIFSFCVSVAVSLTSGGADDTGFLLHLCAPYPSLSLKCHPVQDGSSVHFHNPLSYSLFTGPTWTTWCPGAPWAWRPPGKDGFDFSLKQELSFMGSGRLFSTQDKNKGTVRWGGRVDTDTHKPLHCPALGFQWL